MRKQKIELTPELSEEHQKELDELWDPSLFWLFFLYALFGAFGFFVFVDLSNFPNWLSYTLFAMTCIPFVWFFVRRLWWMASIVKQYRDKTSNK